MVHKEDQFQHITNRARLQSVRATKNKNGYKVRNLHGKAMQFNKENGNSNLWADEEKLEVLQLYNTFIGNDYLLLVDINKFDVI